MCVSFYIWYKLKMVNLRMFKVRQRSYAKVFDDTSLDTFKVCAFQIHSILICVCLQLLLSQEFSN